MTKLWKIVCIVIVSIGLVGCGSSKPKGISDETYDAGVKILETTDKYLDGKLSKEEAESSINILADEFSSAGDKDYKVQEATKRIKSSFYIGDTDVKKQRDSLADALGK